MHNELFSIGPITVHGYGLMIAVGFLLCVLLGRYRGGRKGLNRDAVVDIALLGIVIGFLGAQRNARGEMVVPALLRGIGPSCCM